MLLHHMHMLFADLDNPIAIRMMLAMSTSPSPPKHIAIIMDGNGRWAQQQGLPRTAGHKSGADAVAVSYTHLTLPTICSV